MSVYCLSIGGTPKPTVSEKPVKSLCKMFNRSLKNPSSVQKTCQNIGAIWGKVQSHIAWIGGGWNTSLAQSWAATTTSFLKPIADAISAEISSSISSKCSHPTTLTGQQQLWRTSGARNPPQLLATAQDWRLSVHFEIVPPENCHRHPEAKHPPGHRGNQKHPPGWKWQCPGRTA